MAWTQEEEEHYLSTPWEDELFDEIQKGDTVWYYNDRLQECKGTAVMVGPAGWVVNCDHGPVVVNEGDNYAGHSKAKIENQIILVIG